MALANTLAVAGNTAWSIAPSRRCTCQSSGRRRVRRVGDAISNDLDLLQTSNRRSQRFTTIGGDAVLG